MQETKFHHVRFYNEDGSVHNMGGATIAFVENLKDNSIRYAWALCSPKDNFNKKTGRAIASGRLKSDNFSMVVHDVTIEQFIESFDNFLSE